MDSNEFNKIAGAVLASLLFFLLLGFFSDLIYHGAPGGHGEDHVLAYALETEGTEAAGTEEASVDLAALVANADVAKGEKAFSKCKACHKIEEGANAVGPTLWGVVGRDIASVPGFAYSEALSSLEGTWTLENLAAFLHKPKEFAPGTKMTFGGFSKPQDAVNVIAYLNEADGTPVELAAAGPETATDASAGSEETAESEAAPASTEEPASAETTSEEPSSEQVAATSSGGEQAGGGLAALAATVTAADGEKKFKRCKACHKLEEGKNSVGPSLWGVVGRDKASVAGFNYSDALKGLGGKWTPGELMAFLESPKAYAPGTKMSFAGFKKPEDRMAVILYLNEADGSPEPIE